MNREKLNIRFEEDKEFQHPELTKVKIWIATYGTNVNGSDILKTAFEEALDSLKNIPIIGEWNESIEDFKGHGGKIEITNEGIEWVQTTTPYGVVPESCNPRWELDGEGKEYLVCDGILWTKRYEEVKKVFENTCNQSMEISPTEVEEVNGVMVIKSFNFSAICILGKDTTPCFPSAKMVYTLNKDDFKAEFSLLLSEVENLATQEKGGNTVKKETLLQKFAHLKGDTFEALVSNEDLTLEELEKELFALSVKDLESRIREKLAEIKYEETCWGETYEYRKYYYTDLVPEENIIIAEDNEKYYAHMGIPYEIQGDEIIIKHEEAVRYVRGDWRKFEGEIEPEVNPVFVFKETKDKEKFESITNEFAKVKADLESATADFEKLKAENEETIKEFEILKQFKENYEKAENEAKIQEVVERYSELEKVEGYVEIFEARNECSLDELESKFKLFAYDNGIIVGKKTTKKPQKETVKFSLTPTVKKVDEWGFLQNYTT